MAKRFTDTDKWKREWFCELDLKAKMVWVYLLDQCDHRGVWFRNFKLMSDQLKFKVTSAHLEKWFGTKIQLFDGDKYFIPSFVDFQYGKKLNENNNAHKSVIDLLLLIKKQAPSEPLMSPSIGAQDKDQDKEKDKDKEKEGGAPPIQKPSATQKFHDSMNPENQIFVEKLRELELDSPHVKSSAQLIRERFETIEKFESWVEGVAESKGFKNKDTRAGRIQYLSSALLKEIGAI